MATYRPDPRAYLQLRQTTPEWQMGDDVPIDEGLPPTNTPPTQDASQEFIGETSKSFKPDRVETRTDENGNTIAVDIWYNPDGSVREGKPRIIKPAEKPKEPKKTPLPKDWPQSFKAKDGGIWEWDESKGDYNQVGYEEPPSEPGTKRIQVGDNVWEYTTYKDATGREVIDNSQAPVLVQSAGPKDENDQTGTSLDERVEYSPDKSQQRTYVTSRDKSGKVTRQYTSEWTPTPKEPETPEAKFAREQAERDAINNPRNLSAALAYLSKNPLPAARQLPDNGLDYGPQGGYTPTAKPLSQMLNERIAAQGTGANLIRVTRGSEMKPDVMRQGTDEYNFLTANNLGQPVTTQSIVNKLPWNQQQVDSMSEAERASLGTLLSSQGIDPSELPDLTRRNVAFWNQASKEQQDERLNATPDYRNALMADNAAKVAPYLREQEARRQGTLSSALRGTGRRRY